MNVLFLYSFRSGVVDILYASVTFKKSSMSMSWAI